MKIKPPNFIKTSDVKYSLAESPRPKKRSQRWFLIFLIVMMGLWFGIIFFTAVFANSLLGNITTMRWDSSFGTFVRDYYLQEKHNHLQKFRARETENWWPSKLPKPPAPDPSQCSNIPDEMKFDCFPRGVATDDECKDRGCCFNNQTAPHVPYCFYPNQYLSYKYTSVEETPSGITALLKAQFKSPYVKDIINLRMQITYVSDEVVGVNITNADEERFRFPFPDDPIPVKQPSNPLYRVEMDNSSLGFDIIRRSNNQTIFSTKNLGGFTFADQFLQISAKLPSKYIYGLGEQRNNFLRSVNWNTITLFNHDSVPLDHVNGYGSHPFYLCMEEDGNSHGVISWNHYPTDIVLQPAPAITFRIIGGYMAFYVMLGPSPTSVIEQYQSQVIGMPFLPPYWSLGFHLCRFGYRNVDHVFKILNQTTAAGIPIDTQWVDIDYMNDRNDFTLDQVNFKSLGNFVDQLHNAGRHFVPILDPGISGSEAKGTYPPYDEGLKDEIFVMDSSGKKPFVGLVWNSKSTVFPDFANPKVVYYWIEQIQNMHKLFRFDGLWIDMNEPSNFLNGTADGCPKSDLETPPYLPGVNGGLLSYKTLCMTAAHTVGKHYDIHNLYGALESTVTSFALAQLRGLRPFVITRSSAAGTGKYVGHWTGDVQSTWEDMAHSIGDILSFSMFGIPMVGADICGFNGNTTVPLCQRWSQLGAFYPFSRNHNTDNGIPQDPVSLGADVTKSTKAALVIRYSLLPYLYTLFWKANTKGTPVLQPLFFLDPKDANTYSITGQFLWGQGLMISPVLTEGLTYVKTYFGSGTWYDFHTLKKVEGKGYLAVPAPLDVIPLFYRGGSVIPRQYPGATTTESRKNEFFIDVALDESPQASGCLYWDDGDTINSLYNLIKWTASKSELHSEVAVWNYKTEMILDSINIFAVPEVKKVAVSSKEVPFKYNADNKVLYLSGLKLSLGMNFTVTWS